MKRINGPLLVANQRLNSYGGIQKYMARIADEFTEFYEVVRVIEPNDELGQRKNENVEFTSFRKGSQIFELAGMFLTYTFQVIKSRPAFTLASIWFPSGFVSAIIPKRLRGPLAILAHGSEIAPSRRGIRQKLMQFTFRRSDAIFANSEYVSKLLREAGIDTQIDTLPCGTDKYKINAPRANRPVILSVGRLIERKGFDAMLIAMPQILKVIPEALYEIIGDGPYKPTLMSLASLLGISNSVAFRGFVSQQALAEAYSSAHCFSMPTRRIRDDVEGFGIVFLEAASAELPTIAGIDSGASNAIEDGITGCLVDGRDPAAIANAVLSLLTNDELAIEMGRRGRQRVLRNFSWGRVASEIVERMSAIQ